MQARMTLSTRSRATRRITLHCIRQQRWSSFAADRPHDACASSLSRSALARSCHELCWYTRRSRSCHEFRWGVSPSPRGAHATARIHHACLKSSVSVWPPSDEGPAIPGLSYASGIGAACRLSTTAVPMCGRSGSGRGAINAARAWSHASADCQRLSRAIAKSIRLDPTQAGIAAHSHASAPVAR